MSIDWVTVLAQIANFLVLVWLLKRFLYRPILDGIDAREAEIAARMGEADRAREQAAAAEADFVARQQALQAERDDLAERVRDQAQQQRDALLAQAHDRLEQERRETRTQLARERERFTAALYEASGETLYLLAGRALRDLADARLEAQIARHVVGRLTPLSDELATAVEHADKAVVTTQSPLPEPEREAIREVLAEALPGLAVRFESDDGQSPGLDLRLGSLQLDWTVDSYTDELVGLLEERLASGESGRVGDHGG